MATDNCLHSLTIGQTLSGKSVLNKKRAAHFKQNGVRVVVLDPMLDPGWKADFITDDPEEFLSYVKNPKLCLRCACFIDEAGDLLTREKRFNWCTTQSRHHGHRFHLISQRAQMISPSIRYQCGELFAFNINAKDAKIYAEDFNEPLILKCPELPQGQCIHVVRFQKPRIYRMW